MLLEEIQMKEAQMQSGCGVKECNTLNYSENLWDFWSTKQAVDTEGEEADADDDT